MKNCSRLIAKALCCGDGFLAAVEAVVLFLGQLGDHPVDRREPFHPASEGAHCGAAFAAGDDPQPLFSRLSHQITSTLMLTGRLMIGSSWRVIHF
jgi:hypothetical protein